MSKGFGSNQRQSNSPKQKRQRAFALLKQHRDLILGMAWLGYCQHGVGAICFQELGEQSKIDYVPLNQIADREVLQLVERNDPTLAAVVLYDYGDHFDVLTLSGPHKPQDCYEKLPPHEIQPL